MNIVCTFPGKFGDLLWALPTVRAISETYDTPVTMVVSDYLRPIVPLLAVQPYIKHATAVEAWRVELGAPITPRVPPIELAATQTFHLGYEGWPMLDLPHEIYAIGLKQFGPSKPPLVERLDLQRPWITVPGFGPPIDLAVGFTDEYFELKVGLVTLLEIDKHAGVVLAQEGTRWVTERPSGSYPMQICGWLDVARYIRNSDQFLGCCSSLHVLSCALGKRTVVMEPNPQRHHPIFWPEAVRDRVIQVVGGDGKPTFDARHTRATLFTKST